MDGARNKHRTQLHWASLSRPFSLIPGVQIIEKTEEHESLLSESEKNIGKNLFSPISSLCSPSR